MEISPWLIYWLMQLDSICGFVEAIAVLGSVLLVVLFILRTIFKEHADWDREAEIFYTVTTPLYKFSSVIIPIFILLNVFIPNTKTVAAMILVPPIVNNEQVQQIPDDILTFVRSVIKEYTFDNKEKK
jgi:hypothetical protein